MAKDVEVRTKLRLEDLTSAALGKVQGAFEKTDEAQRKTQGHFDEFGRTFAAQFAAVNIGPAIGQIAEFGKGLVRAGLEGQEADRRIAGMVEASQGGPWAAALDKGQRYGDMLDNIKLAAGGAGEGVENAFQKLIELGGATGKGLDSALKSTGDIATIAKNLGKPTELLSQEFGFMAEGVLRTKGQMFQLLQQTGIFGDKTKGAAAEWAKLTDAKRMELLQYGMGKVASSLGQAAPTMGDLVAKLQTMGGIASEKFGQGLVEELQPGFEALLDELMGGRGEIEKTADAMGREVGRYVREAASEVRKGFDYVKANYAELRDAVIAGFDHAKKVVGWILDHKGEIAVAFGAKAAIGGAKGVLGSDAVKTGTNLVKGAAGLGTALGPALEAGALGSTIAKLTAALGPATMGVAGLGIAVVALGGGALAANAIIEDQNAEYEAHQRAMSNVLDAALEGNVQKTENLVAAMHSLKGGVNSLGDAIGEMDERVARTLASYRGIAESQAGIKETEAASIQNEIAIASRGIQNAYARASTDTSKAGQAYAANLYANQAVLLANAYNEAAKSGNTALQQLAATTLASSKGTQEAFLAAGKDVEGGFGALADMLIAAGGPFADFALKLRAKAGTTNAPTPAAPVMNVGSMTVNIKQEFRDADADRILIAFRRDLTKAAMNRYTTATGSLFGT